MTPSAPAAARYSAARYLALADEGVLGPDDRVELLEGVIVAMSPHNPPHASAVRRAYEALHALVGTRAVVSIQLPLVVSGDSVPEPDVAIVPGRQSDYDLAHPTTALLVVEVADSSLLADRLTKAPIYAAAGIAEYWIVNLRDDVIEVFRDPDRGAGQYRATMKIDRGGRLSVLAFGEESIVADALLPSAATTAR